MFSEEAVYTVNFLWGLLNIILGAMGLYFIYRYVVACLTLEPDARNILLGPALQKWLPVDDEFLLIMGSMYIGFKASSLLVVSARWEVNMRNMRERLRRKKILPPKKARAVEVVDLSRLETFTG